MAVNTENNQIERIKTRIGQIEQHIRSLEEELHSLRKQLRGIESSSKPTTEHSSSNPLLGLPATQNISSTAEARIALFLNLFRCRADVYPRLWENKSKGTKGYSPVCRNEWVKTLCHKPAVKCSDCPSQDYAPLDEKAAEEHLRGKSTIGTYAIRKDDTCIFLAADFDGADWEKDLLAYWRAGGKMGIQIGMERSRSGNGGHGWIFLSEPVPAYRARQLGAAILSGAIAERHGIGLEAYDRFFPNQDYLPKGGFGNLIALPLQRNSRDSGNSVFIDEQMNPIADQWHYLATTRRLSARELENLLSAMDVLTDPSEEDAERIGEEELDRLKEGLAPNLHPHEIPAALSSTVEIDISGIPSPLVAAFKRTAAFANPKYFELQRLRFSTYKTPKYIFCGHLSGSRLILPRGSLDSCREMAEQAGGALSVVDRRFEGKSFRVKFNGTLKPEQGKALSTLEASETGVLVAEPGSGKTVIACALIAKRKLPTLVLVHRKPLLEQWKKQLAAFTTLEPDRIGIIDSENAGHCKVDIAMIQTLGRMDKISDHLSRYGQIIVDECHHIAAFTFESIVNKSPAKYVLGLTATPYRKDGHQPIIHMQCGPVRFDLSNAEAASLVKKLMIRETAFRFPENSFQSSIHAIWSHLTADPARNNVICQDILDEVRQKRTPIVISERKEHLRTLLELVKKENAGTGVQLFLLEGSMSKKAKDELLRQIHELMATSDPFVLFATGSLIGEGFDLPCLNTLFVAMPVAFKGKLIQYAGRLHRSYPGKTEVRIYDYLDTELPLTLSMFKKRKGAYRVMGYIQ